MIYESHESRKGGADTFMEITEIPFAKTVGLKKSDSDVLELHFEESLHNHLQTVAASAQYSLAELASGDYLQQLFPELGEKVTPVLRDSRLKFNICLPDSVKKGHR